MVLLDKTIDIRAPPEHVWRHLTRIHASPSWSPGLVRATPRDGVLDVRPGLVFTTVREDLGLHLESEQETVAAEPPRLFAWRQRAGDYSRNDGRYRLDPSPCGSGTRLHLRLLIELPFVLPRLLTEDAIRRHYSARYDDALYLLKAEVERSREPL